MKKVIITGASSGIGKSIATYFFSKGWTPILVARNQERLEALSKELNNTPYFSCDLSSKTEIHELIKKLVSEHSDVIALINNAGIYKPLSINDDQDDVWEAHFTTNLMSAVRVTRGLWSTLKSNKACVLNISSTLAIRPIPNTAAYSALKAAMNNWTLSLAIEGASCGVRANAICPGIVDTPIHGFHQSQSQEDIETKNMAQGLQPLGRIGAPEDIAGSAFHLCSKDSSWTTGVIFNIDGGILLNS